MIQIEQVKYGLFNIDVKISISVCTVCPEKINEIAHRYGFSPWTTGLESAQMTKLIPPLGTLVVWSLFDYDYELAPYLSNTWQMTLGQPSKH